MCRILRKNPSSSASATFREMKDKLQFRLTILGHLYNSKKFRLKTNLRFKLKSNSSTQKDTQIKIMCSQMLS